MLLMDYSVLAQILDEVQCKIRFVYAKFQPPDYNNNLDLESDILYVKNSI